MLHPLFNPNHQFLERSAAPSLRCRIHVSLQGFEWFLYNRTAGFDNIVSQMLASSLTRDISRPTHLPRHDSRPGSQSSSVHRTTALIIESTAPSTPFYPPSLTRATLSVPLSVRNTILWFRRQLPSLDPKDLLPLGLEVTKGAITCGNSSTPNLLVAEFQRTQGAFGIVEVALSYLVFDSNLMPSIVAVET